MLFHSKVPRNFKDEDARCCTGFLAAQALRR
jgi:hypothetical protein